MKRITVMTPCFNEQENVRELHRRLQTVFAALPQYEFRHLFIDNASTDGTVAVLRELAAEDPNVQVIVNRRNFGQTRSPYHALLQAQGDAVVVMASDLQDPPELVPQFLLLWEAGNPVVLGVKRSSEERRSMFAVRGLYYRLLDSLSEVPVIPHATGFGLYDRSFIETLRNLDDPYPYVRGLVSDLGYADATVPYDQPLRTRGITKNNALTLYDIAMLGLTSHSRLPLRLVTLSGFVLSALSLLAGLGLSLIHI